MRVPPAFWILASLAACSGGGGGSSSSEPFTFETVESVDMDLLVTLDGAPAPHAIVHVVAALVPPTGADDIEDQVTGEVFARGATDDQGRFAASFGVPTRVADADVVVDLPGASGPYTYEELRTLWGPTAPSSRVATDLAGLSSMTVDLVTP